MLSDVTEKIERVERRGPLQVVGHLRSLRAVEGQVAFDLSADALDPRLDDLDLVQAALGRLAARITDQASGTAHHGDRPVSGLLQAAHGDQLYEVPEMQAWRGWIEAAVEGDGARDQRGGERLRISAVGDEASPLEVVEDLGGHRRRV